MDKYLGVAVSHRGIIFAHAGSGDNAANDAARGRGDWPYMHLYEGDDIVAAIAELQKMRADMDAE
jgi:hypothetical protein